MYVDFEYYVNIFGGYLIEEEEFPFLEKKAETYIRTFTYVRGDVFELKIDAVMDAVCVAAEVCCTYERRKKELRGVVKSENTDGYSVTYVTEQRDGQTEEETLRKKVYEAVYSYLLPTGWLSRKVGCRHAY